MLTCEEASLPLIALSTPRVEALKHRLAHKEKMNPKYVNLLLGYGSAAFNRARETGRFLGTNPFESVAKRLECDPDLAAFDEKLKKIAKAKPQGKPKRTR